MAAKSSQREDATNAYIRYTSNNLDKNWKMLGESDIKRALQIPSQPWGRASLRSWSCGPNSVARSLRLLGKDCCKDEDAFEHFANSFPKGLGWPATAKGYGISAAVTVPSLIALTQTSSVKKALMLTATALTGVSPFILGLFKINAGGPPSWLAPHLDQHLKSMNVTVDHVMVSTFDEVLAEIRSAISGRRPVIPLVAFDAFSWHYFNIIGFNDTTSEVMILDTDKSMSKLGFSDLAVLMDLGYLSDDSYMTYLTANVISTVSKLGNYNLLTIKPVAS
jgi:hypothetical protein